MRWDSNNGIFKRKLNEFDGLVLCGGCDIHPKYYGEVIDGSVNIDNDRDEKEFYLFKYFYENKNPILGICRGAQLINIALGGSLYQDISNAKEHTSFVKGVDLVHKIKIIGDNFLFRIYNEEFFVNSHHHQAVNQLGEGLDLIAVSHDGKTVETFKHSELPIFGVQWHPERMCFKNKRKDTVDGSKIFEFFIDICKKI